MDTPTLETLARWVLSGGAGVLVAWLIETYRILPEQMDAELKRLAVWAMTALVAWLFWGVLLAGGAEPMPFGWWAWANALVSVAATAIIAGQVTHGRIALSKR